MRTVNDVYNCIDGFVRFSLQPQDDNSGLLIGDRNAPAEKILFCLDPTLEALKEATQVGAGLVVSHHPIIFDPLFSIPNGSAVEYAIRNSIAVICAHIPADEAENGANYLLADKLGLTDVQPFARADKEGVFRSEGYSGKTQKTMSSADFAKTVKAALGCPLRYCEGRPISSVAVCGGSGSFLIDKAVELGVDCLVTGEAKYHHFLAAKAAGVTLIDATHYATEIHIAKMLMDIVGGKFGYDGLFLSRGSNPISFC